ncbi:MAG: deoxyribose-phosphate aldolase [Bdellovibrionia bacterium]
MQHYIDHTLLKPETTIQQIESLCREAIEFEFFSVCINPAFVKSAKKLLNHSKVKVCTVIGFPLGATATAVKAFETQQALADGADEFDMVISIGMLKSGDLNYVKNDIAAVVKAAQGKTVKVIIETSLLTQDEKRIACELSVQAGAHFVKTSTGFSGGGANIDDVLLMKSTVGNSAQVKASGGIKDAAFAKNLIAAGATRLGTSSGVNLVKGLAAGAGY